MPESRMERREQEAKAAEKKPKKKRGCGWKILVILLVIVGLLIWKVYSDVRNSTDQILEPVMSDQLRDVNDQLKKKGSLSVLLMGIDTGEDGRTEQGRSDSMMLVTINVEDNRSTIFSIPRDTYVDIPGRGQDKINHAYAFGGAELSINTVQNYFQVPVDYYVAVNMKGLEDIVDVLGGVSLVPTLTFSQGNYNFVEGQEIKLDGQGALAYVRNRYDDPSGDYGRQARQRQVIAAAVKEIASLNTILNYKGVLGTLENNVQTNASFDEMMAMFSNYRGAMNDIEEYQLEGQGDMLNGVYYDFISDETLYEVRTKMQTELQYTPE